MKIIVTGANSFLGAALCMDLINKGYEVFALINKNTDRIKSLISKISNVKNISDFSIDYIDETGNPLNESNVYTGIDSKYFNVSCNINSVIKTINS